MRTKLHRKEKGKWIAIGTAVVYIKDSDEWRETTRTEMEVLDIQSSMTTSNPPMNISIDLPRAEDGTDGDYYALLYPLGQNGKAWDGEVWTAS